MEYRKAERCFIAGIILFRFLLYCSIRVREAQQGLARAEQRNIQVGRWKNNLVKDTVVYRTEILIGTLLTEWGWVSLLSTINKKS